MGSISVSGHLEVPRTGTGESVDGTCIRELRRGWGSRYVVRIKWAGALTFGKLSFNLRDRSDAGHAGHPWECYDIGHYHDG